VFSLGVHGVASHTIHKVCIGVHVLRNQVELGHVPDECNRDTSLGVLVTYAANAPNMGIVTKGVLHRARSNLSHPWYHMAVGV
jgi:hypothetical protein